MLVSGQGCVILLGETKSNYMRVHKSENRLDTSVLRPRLFRAASLVFLLAAQDIRAAEKSLPLKKQKEKPAPEARLFHDNSVEALTESARHSVVVVSHEGRDGKEGGVGSGFIVSANGLIATSLHVIGEARPITVHLANGKRYDVTEVHAWDRKSDLAIIRIDANNLPALPLGDSDTLKQGMPVAAIGNPLGLENSVVQGVVSAKRDFDGFEMIQLAIPIEPGNSGGPLLDMQGRVHGLLTMKSMMSANLGFAMPINLLKPLLEKPNPVPMNRWLTIGALNPKEWTPLMGARWSQKVGRVHVEGLGKGFGGRSLCLSQKQVDARPYEVAVSVRLEDESGAAGLIFASDGDQKHYGFYPTGGQLRLTRFDGPDVYSWAILQTVPSAHYRPGDWNFLRVRVDQEKIYCYVNGELVITSTDDKLPNGKIGLAKFRDTKADFKDFQLGDNLVLPNAPVSAELVANITKEIQNRSDKSDAAILEVLKSNAEASRGILSERAIKLEREAAHLRELGVAVHRQSVQQELVKIFEMPEEKVDLFHAALLVAKLDNPDLAIEAYRSQLETMAREISARLPADADNSAKLETLTKYLFAENGFHGSRSDYYNRANSYMNQVLDDREGLPITLSVLFIELAKQIGMKNVFGVPLPGHFIAKCTSGQGEDQLIDVFDGGKRLTRAQANDLVVAYTGARLRENQLKAATKREIIVRMLGNLLGIAQDTESAASSLRYLDLIVAISPDSPADRLERARLRLRSGDSTGAKQDFKWLLDNEPPGIDLERITEIYRAL